MIYGKAEPTTIKSFIKTLPEAVGIVSPKTRRKICFVITNRIHYARQELLLKQLRTDPDLELQLVVGGSALLEKYSEVPRVLEQGGFEIHERMLNMIEGGDHVAMAKTAGLMVLELANTLAKLNPDVVLIRGDRFEQLAVAMTAAYLNRTIAHIEGGDLSGTIDESARHAITKLAHVHFVTNEPARERLVRMGENPRFVFNVGSPDLEFAEGAQNDFDPAAINQVGVGGTIDFTKPYVVVIQHPVTSEPDNRENILKTLQAVSELGVQALWFWPNPDAGTDAVSRGIRQFRERYPTLQIRFVIDFEPRTFIALLGRAACLVGNSSAGIKEAPFLGVPVVNIGTRQEGRLRAAGIMDVGHDPVQIKAAVGQQLTHGPYEPSYLYYKPETSKQIRGILKSTPLYTQKRFYEGTRA